MGTVGGGRGSGGERRQAASPRGARVIRREMDENLWALSLLAASLTPGRQALDRLDGVLAGTWREPKKRAGSLASSPWLLLLWLLSLFPLAALT